MNKNKSFMELGFKKVEYKCKECKFYKEKFLNHKHLCCSGHLPKIMQDGNGGCIKMEFDSELFRKECGK